MKSLVKMGVVLAAALTLAAYSTNAQTPAPSTETNTTATPRPKSHQMSGKIASVDIGAKTITVTLRNGTSETVQVTSKTRMSKDGAPATLEDATVGEPILAVARKDDAGNWVAFRIRFGAPKKKAAPSTNAPPAGQ
jgi:hypothetical protein